MIRITNFSPTIRVLVTALRWLRSDYTVYVLCCVAVCVNQVGVVVLSMQYYIS